MEKNFRKNQHLDSGMVNHAEMSGTTTEKRIDIWANSQPIGLAFERLSQVFKEGINQNMLFIRYEDLMKDPDQEMKRLYEYFELPYYQHDFDNVQQITKEDDSVYGIYGDHNIQPKLEYKKSNAKEVLGTHAYTWVKNNYKWFFDEFKYY
jgi:sulfotransferase